MVKGPFWGVLETFKEGNNQQPADIYNLQTYNLQTYRPTTYNPTTYNLQTYRPTILPTGLSQPGGPEGAGGFLM